MLAKAKYGLLTKAERDQLAELQRRAAEAADDRLE